MNQNQLKRLFPNASRSTLSLNTDSAGSPAELERTLGDAALGQGEAENRHPSRFLIRVTSIRKRLLDPDNLAEKYHIDCLRYAGVIHGDAAHQVEVQTTQRKAGKKEEEHTLIEVFDATNLPNP